jgi:threonine synthase
MDIQVASNFERILFEALDRDGGDVERLYAQFVQSGGFDLPAQAHDFLLNRFYAEAVSDAETEDAMRALWNEGRHGYLACPHTAVALHAPGKAYAMRGDAQLIATPLVTLATAHPAKFPATVERATGVRPALPARCADLFARKETFCSLAAEPEAVKRFIRERSRAWA